MKPTIRWARIAMAAVLAATGTASHAQDKPITLKMAHLVPPSHVFWEKGGKPFSEEVTAKTNGRVKFEVYHSNQLGSDYLTILKTGLADIVMLVPAYQPDKMPLSTVGELPNLYSTSCEGTAKLSSIAREGGVLYERELKALGVRVLFANALPQYKIMSTTREIKSLQDMQGLKVRAVGGSMNKTVRALGGVPLSVPAGELYDSLNRGTIDAGFYPYTGVKPFKIEEIVRHTIEGMQLGGANIMFAISDKGWKALPEDVRKVLDEAGLNAQKSMCKGQDDGEAALREEFIQKNNWKITTLTPEQAAQWNDKVKSVTADWVAEMDRARKPGAAVLKAFQDASGK
ncbi:TRAP transporter substrate-binding protein DctP [Alicycliphilus denitrificans]|uniref:TRAP transporter substrate-binding protein n=1 Tax=Alicycliphilus denitrificans TaxID=179636 RepID=UPI003A80318F